MRSKLALGALTIFVATVIVASMREYNRTVTSSMRDSSSTATSRPPWPIENRRYFATVDDLKSAWAGSKIFTTVHEGRVSDLNFIVIEAFPYSGVNSVDVYLYVCREKSWRLRSITFLTPPNQIRVGVRATLDSVELLSDGVVSATFAFPTTKPGATSRDTTDKK